MADDNKTDNAEVEDKADAPDESPEHHEEGVVETTHEVVIAGEKLEYTAAGRLLLREEEGKKRASFFFTSYTRNGVEDTATRPIMFSFNGGPGSSSVWLHLGAFGPRRVLMDEDGFGVRPPGRLVENEHSILDAADLVFIDPVGTGFSRAIPSKDAKEFHHFKKDIHSVSDFIRSYLSRHQRWASPKFLAGESYGTTRSAGVAGHLFDRHGVYFNGIVLVSSILNFQTAGFDSSTGTFARGNDLPYVVFLPSYATAAWYHQRLEDDLQQMPLRDLLDEVEEFATNEHTIALFKGDRLAPDEFAEIGARVARYTGLSEQYVARHDLRVEILRFCKELLRDKNRTIGRIDARYTGIDRFKDGDSVESDPSLDSTMGLYTSALNDYVRRELGYDSDLPYEILSSETNENWDYEDFKNAYVDVSETLRRTMTRNPFMKVLVASGYFDLATPHFATEYTFSHLGLDPEIRENVSMTYYDAGHMMYAHVQSLAKLGADVRQFIVNAAG